MTLQYGKVKQYVRVYYCFKREIWQYLNLKKRDREKE